jgi:hypothetical protein
MLSAARFKTPKSIEELTSGAQVYSCLTSMGIAPGVTYDPTAGTILRVLRGCLGEVLRGGAAEFLASPAAVVASTGAYLVGSVQGVLADPFSIRLTYTPPASPGAPTAADLRGLILEIGQLTPDPEGSECDGVNQVDRNPINRSAVPSVVRGPQGGWAVSSAPTALGELVLSDEFYPDAGWMEFDLGRGDQRYRVVLGAGSGNWDCSRPFAIGESATLNESYYVRAGQGGEEVPPLVDGSCVRMVATRVAFLEYAMRTEFGVSPAGGGPGCEVP